VKGVRESGRIIENAHAYAHMGTSTHMDPAYLFELSAHEQGERQHVVGKLESNLFACVCVCVCVCLCVCVCDIHIQT
jgi:hypothetical protein